MRRVAADDLAESRLGVMPVRAGQASKDAGRVVRSERRRREWSQTDLAVKMRKSGHVTWCHSTVAEIEAGRRNLTLDEWAALLRVLRLSKTTNEGFHVVTRCEAALRVQVADPAGDMREYLLTCQEKTKHAGSHAGTLETAGGGVLVYEWPRVPGSEEALVG